MDREDVILDNICIEMKRINEAISESTIKSRKQFLKLDKEEQKEEAIQYAKQLTEKAQMKRKEVTSLLENIYLKKLIYKWSQFKDNSKFDEELKVIHIPQKPSAIKYKPKASLFVFLPSVKSRKQKEMHDKLQDDLKLWEDKKIKIENQNSSEKERWLKKKGEFESEQKKNNDKIDEMNKLFNEGNIEGIEFYFNTVLSRLSEQVYPQYFNLEWELQYNKLNQLMIINYRLPKKSDIVNLKDIKYVQSRNEFKKTYIKETEINKIYENGLYQLCLRINHDIYKADSSNYIEGIVFNGYLTDINVNNGQEETKCLLTLQTEIDKFMENKLDKVDAKSCFKSLKGIAGAKLCDLIAVAPIANIDSNDKRFVESREIGEMINGYNLALMHWEDFEHLIREVFEKEFAKEGAEVKITQASKDGGVDAIIFDPNPIKGGKYIIQAKRYTNVVGVSAVRDLYGTVLNEGASKGILVTTSDYGHDSYEFAKDKPITLLNGSNLLHILEKHGYEARIDLKEARVSING